MRALTKITTFLTSITSRSFLSSSHNYTRLIETCGRDLKLINPVKTLHAHLIIDGSARTTRVASKLITFYVRTELLVEARKLFDGIPRSNPGRWIVLIGACSRSGFFQEVLKLFSEMQKEGFRRDEFVLPSVLRACGNVFDVKSGKLLHCVILKEGFGRDVFVMSALIDMYSRCGEVEKARRVFDGMVGKDLVALNAMVSGYVRHGSAKEGFELVERARISGVEFDVVTWNALIAGFAQKGDEVMVSRLFEFMVIDRVEPDVVSWTTVISGFVQSFHNAAAFCAFRQMLRNGFYPNSATISSLLPACASVANVRHGREIHGYAVVIGVQDDVYVRSALVDMYAKCGFISEARMLFKKMPERNTVTWNSMIFGCANHGHCNEAIELFHQMDKMEEQKADHLTFTAVLTACSHAGLVELGQSLFLLMQEKHKIVPRLEHYACMVDLFGRAGKLMEAYDMIKTMPMEPDLFVWGALLGACRNHGDINLAEIASKQLAKLEPGNAGNSMLLSNLYADAGSWESVARFKKIKGKKLRKFSGHSWI